MADPLETLEQLQARHRKEQRELQARVTNKKKNATKKSRKGISDECAQLESQLKERQADELRRLESGGAGEQGSQQDRADVDDGEGVNGTGQPLGAPEDEVEDELAAKVKAVRFDEKTAGKGAPPDAAETGSQPRKRNRQKERLARRAAEQEAAAEAAESEASTMVDHRGIERSRMREAITANGLVEKEIQPDGHCLFSAVADQLSSRRLGPETEKLAQQEGDAILPPYKAVRRVATDYMRTHSDDFAPFMEDDFETYVTKMRDTAEWGGQLELQALANAYGVEIQVLQNGKTEVIEPTSSTATTGDKAEKRRIWLAYYRHGYGLGEHYNSLRSKTT